MNYFVTKTTFHYVTDSEMSRNDEIERSLGMNTLESFLFVPGAYSVASLNKTSVLCEIFSRYFVSLR